MTRFNPNWRNALPCAAMIAALTLASPVVAQESVLELNPDHTQVNITLGDILHTVHGTFKLKRGTVKFDPATGQASGLVVVDATSGDTGNHARDKKMHKDVLESAQYPEITFTPRQVEGQVYPEGEFKVQVLGTFAMHGASQPLTLVVQAHMTGGQLRADTRFTIPYVNWGMKNPSNLFLRVNDSVDITIHATGLIKPAAAK